MKRTLLCLWAATALACTTATQVVTNPDAESNPPDGGDVTPDTGTVGNGMDAGAGDGGLQLGVPPPGRSDMAVAIDPDSKRVFMIDGDKALPVQCNPAPSDFVEDAWVFDPATRRWAGIEITSGTKPMKRVRGSGAWDAMRKRVLIFGGRFRDGTVGSYTFLNDVWALDPATGAWTELSPQGNPSAPSGRMNSVFVADPDHDRVIVHAGGTTSGIMFAVNSQTWAFNLADNTWHQLQTGGAGPPMPRLFHVGALDKTRHRLFVWGGAGADAFTAATFYDDLWYLDLDQLSWTLVPNGASTPIGKIKAAMEYDGPRDRLVLFGGHDNVDVSNDLWTFDLAGLAWTRRIQGDQITGAAAGTCMFPGNFATIDPMSPERREAHLFAISGDVALTFSGETDCGISDDTWLLDLASLSWAPVNAAFSGLTCPRTGRTDCDQPNVMLCN